MTEIKFSIYGEASPLENHEFLLKEFETLRRDTVQVSRMTWDDAWPQLLNYSLHGGSPDISHIGSIWTSSLVGMEVLRLFNHAEINTMGGVEAFFAPCWQNAMLSERPAAWGIPFGAYIYVVLYRRDLLQKAGIDEQTAFSSAPAMIQTLERLRTAGVPSPIIMPSGTHYRPRVHIAVSWIWGAGGDYISADGREILFDEPEALGGLETFFELYRHMARSEYNLPPAECLRRFAEGDSAVTVMGSGSISEISQRSLKSGNLDNIGIAPLPGVTWVGGSNFVVWKETRLNPYKEQTALALAEFLTSRDVQLKYAATVGAIPARIEVLPRVEYGLPGANQVFDKALRAGRAYQPVRLWVRFLGELSNTFDNITAEILAEPALDLGQTLSNHLAPLARKFRLVLRR